MTTIQIAARNILRNRRRSLASILVIAVSAFSILLFGGFVASIMYGMETGFVQNNGHLHIYPEGYFEFGSGNPGAYGIANYEEFMVKLKEDPFLKEKINVISPFLLVYGIVSSFEKNVSKTFMGRGIVPSDVNQMRHWIGSFVRNKSITDIGFSDSDIEAGVVGEGMGRILHLCKELNIPNCRTETIANKSAQTADDKQKSVLGDIPEEPETTTKSDSRPQLDLLVASNQGAPNVVSVFLSQAVNQGVKELDENFLAMHLAQAQKLLYGSGEKKVTGLVIQLKDTRMIPEVKKHLQEILQKLSSQPLEIKTFTEVTPVYDQVMQLFNLIFTFISMIMGIVIISTLINTMSMNVVERFNEIGTLRALGVRRNGILFLFVSEGFLLGVIGTAVGALLAIAVSLVINSLHLTWIAPGSVRPAPFVIQIFANVLTLPMTCLKLIALSMVAAFFPSKKAAQLEIVDALRHS